MDPRSFSRRLRVLAREVEANANLIKRKVALAVDAALVLGTPVDTGRARSNWQVILNAPAGGERAPFAPGKGLGIGEGANARAALAEAQAVIAGAGYGDDIHITNNLSYIGELNDGTSAQAPAGFVEAALLSGVAQVKGARVLVRANARTLAFFSGDERYGG